MRTGRARPATGFLQLLGQREVERRALANRALREHLPAVALDDAPEGSQADAGALVVLGGVQAREGREQLARVLHVEADAVVAHVITRLALALRPAKLDPGVGRVLRELPGVVQHVEQRRT